MPRNCDDHDLREVSKEQPTISSYCLVLARMALLMPQLVNGGHDYHHTNSQKHYQHVLDMDLKMRSLVSDIPAFLRKLTPEDPQWPSWVRWARSTLTISAADKIIMIHRAFLIQSFRDPTYAYTRATCLSAALTVLREYESIYESNVADIWIVPAFTIGAAIVVALDLLYKADPGSDSVGSRRIVQTVLSGLTRTKHNKMAERGARILTALLEEEQKRREAGRAAQKNDPPVNIYRVRDYLEESERESPKGTSSLAQFDHDVAPENSDELELWLNEFLSGGMTDGFTLDPLENVSFASRYGQNIFDYDMFK